MKQQELIQYIRAYTQLVPAELVADMDAPAPAIDMDDCYIALKGKPERETLLALVRANAHTEKPDQPSRPFNPFDGGQYSHVDLDAWLGRLHQAWRESLTPRERAREEAHKLTRPELKDLSLRFMAVASSTRLTALISPKRLAIEGMEYMLGLDLYELAKRRRDLPAAGTPGAADLVAALERDEAAAAQRPAEILAFEKSARSRGFYAISSLPVDMAQVLGTGKRSGGRVEHSSVAAEPQLSA